MKFHLFAALAIFAAAPHAMAANLTIPGAVQASWTKAEQPSPSPDLILRPGHAIRISVSGSVDVNQEQKKSRKCGALGFGCKTVRWTEHHWMTPAQWPIEVIIRAKDTGTIVARAEVRDTPYAMPVIPLEPGGLGREFEVAASLAGVGAHLDPARSTGSYAVSIEIDAAPRVNDLRRWFLAMRPPAKLATSPLVLDRPMLEMHSRAVGKALRDYATTAFPLTGPNADSHEMLLRKAVEVSPSDVDNSLALVAFFRASGLYAQAEAELARAVADLEGKADPLSQRQAGDLYMTWAYTTLARGGAISPTSAQKALGHADRAAKAFDQARRDDLEAQALGLRGRLLRGMRTPEALKEAVIAFEGALAGTPLMSRGQLVSEAPNGAHVVALDWTNRYRVAPINDPWAAGPTVSGGLPILWDYRRLRLLELRGTAAFWRQTDLTSAAEPGPILPEQVGDARNGATLGERAPGALVYPSTNGKVFPLTVDCTPPPVPGSTFQLPVGPAAVSLGPDGDVIGIACSDKMRMFGADATGAPVKVAEITIPLALGAFGPTQRMFAGPRACGVVLITAQVFGYAPGPPIAKLLRPSGHHLSASDRAHEDPGGTARAVHGQCRGAAAANDGATSGECEYAFCDPFCVLQDQYDRRLPQHMQRESSSGPARRADH
jgi:hypothetical protein